MWLFTLRIDPVVQNGMAISMANKGKEQDMIYSISMIEYFEIYLCGIVWWIFLQINGSG